MTNKQFQLIVDLQFRLFAANYPPTYEVTKEEMEAAETAISEWLIEHKENVVLSRGEHGLYFKNVQLVLRSEK